MLLPSKSTPRPLFHWNLSIPTDWAYVDLRDGYTQQSAQQIFEDFYVPLGVSDHMRQPVTEYLEKLAAFANQKRAFLCIMLPRAHSDGTSGSMEIIMRWHNERPNFSTTSDDPDITTARLPSGASYHLRSSTDADPVRTQAMISMPGTKWTLIINGTASSAELHEELHNTVTRITNSYYSSD